MGLNQRKDIKDYWSTLESDDSPFFRSVFSRDRFLQLFGMLHVGNPSGDRQQKIQLLLDILIPLFQKHYTLSKAIAVDESVINFKGRVSFRQYLKGKPHPWGVKAFVLAESKTGYLYNVSIYYGKDTQLDRPDLPHTARVVVTLTT